MVSKTRSTTVDSPARAVGPETFRPSSANESSAVTEPDASARQSSATADRETRRERSRRKAHRSRLHGYAVVTVLLVACLIALAAANTAEVRASWVFGSSHVRLVWLVLIAALLGWLLGLVATGAFHWRTRAPRRSRGSA